MDERIDACFEIAAQAFSVVNETHDTTTMWKARADPLSAADKASTAFIVRTLASRFRDDGIICEDASSHAGSSGYTWLCDPLDGTLNFIRGGALWGVSVALLRGDEVIAGCVVEGTSGDVFKAVLGGGAHRNGEQIHVSEEKTFNMALVGFDCPYDMAPRNDTTDPAIRTLLAASGALRCYGSCAVALCHLAAGEIDVYAVEHGKPWDFGAGTLVVREARGKVTTWSGTPYHPWRNVQVLASNSALHDEAVKLIAPFDVKEIYGRGARGKAGLLNAFWLPS